MTVALIALFAGFTGSAIAQNVVPLAKRALTADKAKVATTAQNARRLQGQTAGQIAATPGPATDAATLNGQTAAQIAATPGPSTSSGAIPASAITYRTQSWSVNNEDDLARDTALCQAGEKVIGGGWDQASGIAYPMADKPMPDGSGWRVHMLGESGNDLPAVGTFWAVCLKVS
jgi:hypothetical protein